MDDNDLRKWADPEEIEEDSESRGLQSFDESGHDGIEHTVEDDEDYIGDDEDFGDEVIIKQPKTPIWKRGEIKLPVAAVGTLTMLFMGYAFMRGTPEQVSSESQQAVSSAPTQAPIPNGAETVPNDAENSKLKTKLALGSQEQELKALNQKTKPAPTQTSAPAVPPTPSPAPTTVSQAPPTRIVYPSSAPAAPPLSYSRPAPTRSYTPPEPRPYRPAPVVSTPAPPIQRSPQIQTPAEPPVQETTFVSYGRLPGIPNAGGRTVANSGNSSGVIYTSTGNRFEGGQSFNSFNAEQMAFLSGDRYAQIPRGSRLKGEMQTPVIAEPGQEFLIAILEQSGNIPKGSYASAVIDQVYGDGLMTASVRGIVTPDGQSFMMPQNAVQVMASNGKPLIAKRIKGGPNIAKMIGNVALGAISNATGSLNRPRTRINTETGNVYEEYGNNNLTASLLQGGVNSILPMIQQQQSELQQDLSGTQSSIRFLKAGTNVHLQAY